MLVTTNSVKLNHILWLRIKNQPQYIGFKALTLLLCIKVDIKEKYIEANLSKIFTNVFS